MMTVSLVMLSLSFSGVFVALCHERILRELPSPWLRRACIALAVPCLTVGACVAAVLAAPAIGLWITWVAVSALSRVGSA